MHFARFRKTLNSVGLVNETAAGIHHVAEDAESWEQRLF
jgi:hypothetical protein